MGYSKEKGKGKKKKSANNFSDKFKKGWSQKRPVLFFVGGFCLLMILFYVFWNSEFYSNHIHHAIISFNAILSNEILNLLGQHTQVSDSIIFSSSHSISVSKGCDAIEAIALFIATTLAFPMSWNTKIKRLIIGVVVLILINLVRVVTLFLAGVYAPSTFDVLHTQIWPVIIIVFATGLWIFLILTDRRKRTDVTN